MTTTVYTFHAARDHSIQAAYTLADGCMAHYARQQASLDAELGQGTNRYYVHNGVGVIAAFLTRNGQAHQILRDDYRQFDAAAKVKRTEADLIEA